MTTAEPVRPATVVVSLKAEIHVQSNDGSDRMVAVLGGSRMVHFMEIDAMKMGVLAAVKLRVDPVFEQLRDAVAEKIVEVPR